MADDKIKYSDLIAPDDSIEYLILQLDDLNKQYGTMINAIRAGAKEIIHAMKSISSASSENRAAIDENAAAASRLERAQKELKFAMSDTGKQVAWLKSQISETNRSSVDQQNAIKALDSSYNKLKLELKDNIQLWQSLTAAERADAAMGGQVLSTILNLKSSIQALDAELKVQVTRMSEVQKAQERLNYLRSEEGQKLIALKKEISEILRGQKDEKQTIDQLAAAQEKLSRAKSEYNQKLIAVNDQIREANRIAKLTAQVNSAATGSYNQLAAQYQLNKIKLNAMSQEQRRAVDVGRKLEAETLRIYKQMIVLQEATGNHTLSVGNYTKAWNGLSNAVNQIVREMPAATMGINTFTLAISNNVPILIDEIQRVRDKNKLLRAEGKPTQNIARTIASSLFGWQTALIALMTVMSMHGKEIIEWIGNLFNAKNAAISTSEALDNIAKELENTNGSYGSNIVKLKQLQEEWKNLKTTAEKNQWIRDNESAFRSLGISVTNVTEAENAFVNNTNAVIDALKKRAKAAAAQKLAEEQYEKALIKKNEAETEKKKRPSKSDVAKSNVSYISTTGTGPATTSGGIDQQKTARALHRQRIKDLEREADEAEKDGDAYFKLAKGYNAAANAKLRAAGIDIYHKPHKKTRTRHPREKKPRDLTDTINRNDITIQRQYEESITKLQNDEYAKRRKEAADRVQDENNKLREMYRKNEEYVANVDKKYKQLTDYQKKQIEQQQKWITETIANNLKYLDYQIQQIMKEQQINAENISRQDLSGINRVKPAETKEEKQTITNRIDIEYDEGEREASLLKERQLMTQFLDIEYQMILDTNEKLRKEGDKNARSEEEINAEHQQKMLAMWAKYDKTILDIRKQNIDDQLDLVKKGSEEELILLLQKNEIARQIAIAENAAKPADQQVNTSTINKKFDKSDTEIRGTFEMTGFDEAQKQALAEFNIVKHSETEITKFKLEQEKARWQKQIGLAKSGALNWSDAQIAAAEATVKGIDRKISENDSFANLAGKKGLGGAVLSKLGLSDEQIDAIEVAANVVIEQLQAIAQAEVDLAQQAVDKAKERVEAAQSAYDAEVEARANGYANNVATAKKELQQEKKNQREKEKILEAAQRRQEALNTVMQASNLVTASALIWAQLGFPWALPAIAAMWTSFAVAKVKAMQVTRSADQEYGEGGLEFLEGGSHASGNDIDLQTKNSKGKNMRAEGGEALAVINKRSTRRYRRQLPDIINSLNKGTFEDKYLKAFERGETLQAQIINSQSDVNLTKIEQLIDDIRKQNSQKIVTFSDGTTVEIKGNVTRYYK